MPISLDDFTAQFLTDENGLLEPREIVSLLTRLARGLAPTGSCVLPGAIVDVLEEAAHEAGVGDRFHRNYRNTHNAAIRVGANRDPDLVVFAHMDKPGFCVERILSPQEAVLLPVSAVRMPDGITEVGAIGMRFDLDGNRLVQSSSGRIQCSRSQATGTHLRYRVETGDLTTEDQFTLCHPLEQKGTRVTVNSLDDCAGQTVNLGVARALIPLQPLLEKLNKTLLLVFTDGEEWPAKSNIFGMGAMRMGSAVPPPSVGAIVMDTQLVGNIRMGEGLSYGFVSGGGMGPPVPHDSRALQNRLAERLNQRFPGTAQRNDGYFSRSDESGFVRWARAVGLFGVPVDGIHQGPETCDVRDIQGAIRFVAAFSAVLLGAASIH